MYLQRQERHKPVLNKAFLGIINECLTLANYVHTPRGKGIRILSIDGGGMRYEVSRLNEHFNAHEISSFRGLCSINALRRIENLVGEPIHTMFDYMSGVSTGAVITAMLGKHIFRSRSSSFT